jgi:hypothetical protein
MPKYKYEGNRSPTDGTVAIILEVDKSGKPTRSIGIGCEGELTHDKYLALKDIFVLKLVEDEVEKPKLTSQLVKSKDKTVAPAADRA